MLVVSDVMLPIERKGKRYLNYVRFSKIEFEQAMLLVEKGSSLVTSLRVREFQLQV